MEIDKEDKLIEIKPTEKMVSINGDSTDVSKRDLLRIYKTLADASYLVIEPGANMDL